MSSPNKSRFGWGNGQAFMLALFLVAFAVVVWITNHNARQVRLNELAYNTVAVSESARLRLGGNEEYLLMLAKNRADGALNNKSFQERASKYVLEHPEMINITWVDAEFVIQDVAPLASNRQILGLHLDLPEPKRASRLAQEVRHPVYSNPFEAIQGQPSFEIVVPVFDGNDFRGLFVGVYSCKKIVEHLVPEEVHRTHHVSLVDGSGRMVYGSPKRGPVDEKLVRTAFLTPREAGVQLRFGTYGTTRLGWALPLLEILCVALALGMAYTVWALNREIARRKQAEEILQQKSNLLEEELAERQVTQEALQDQTVMLEEEIEDRKRVEEALTHSEATVRNKLKAILEPDGDIDHLELSDIIDSEVLRSMMQDFYELTGMLGAVLDVSGKVLVAVGWQDICTKFHRCHPETLKHCHESDTVLTSDVQPGTFKRYRCKNNMWDMVTPVVVGGKHVGNVFIGQYFYRDETPDVELFRAQARRYGFDETEYLAALDRVPRFTQEAVEVGMHFYATLAGVISSLSFSSIRLSRMLAERNQAREELFRLMREQQVILDYAPVGISLVRDRTQVWVNRKVVEVFQYTKEEMEGQSIRKLFRSQQAFEQVGRDSAVVLAEGREFVFEQEMIRRDGSPVWIKFTGRAIEPGNLSEGVIWLQEDITDLIKSEEQIQLKDFSLATITDAIYWISADGKIWEINNSATDMLGYTREEFLTMTIPDIDPSDLAEKWQAHWKNLKQHGSLRFETRHKTKDGRFITVDITANYCCYRDVEYNCAVVRDVTDQKLLEEQLRQSQKMEAIGLLAGGVAHDFNNILMVIMGYGNILKMDGDLNDSQQEKIEAILSSAAKATHLTQGLLAFSRKQVLAPKPVNINDLTQKVHEFIARIIGEDIQLKVTNYGEGLTIYADAGQIEQVLINLATNARDAMPKGGLLAIETGLQLVVPPADRNSGGTTPGRYAVVTVSDTGCGMDGNTRKRIFEPFFTTKEFGKGTGLGMAIVYGIVKQHNGFINVYSEPGHGSTFRVYFPLCELTAPFASEEPEPVTPPKGGTETVLLAEDDIDVRNLVVKVLNGSGYQVIQAVDGQDAVEKFVANRDRIDIIVMDMIMPKKNGKDAFDEISRITSQVKVIYLSGYTADFMQSRGLFEERIELVSKPVQPTDLLRKIREALDAR